MLGNFVYKFFSPLFKNVVEQILLENSFQNLVLHSKYCPSHCHWRLPKCFLNIFLCCSWKQILTIILFSELHKLVFHIIMEWRTYCISNKTKVAWSAGLVLLPLKKMANLITNNVAGLWLLILWWMKIIPWRNMTGWVAVWEHLSGIGLHVAKLWSTLASWNWQRPTES